MGNQNGNGNGCLINTGIKKLKERLSQIEPVLRIRLHSNHYTIIRFSLLVTRWLRLPIRLRSSPNLYQRKSLKFIISLHHYIIIVLKSISLVSALPSFLRPITLSYC
jgi:hypothetical protein